MAQLAWRQPYATAQGDGTAITNTVTQATLLPTTGAKFTLPAGVFQYVGQMAKITATGRISNVVTTPGTLLFQVLFGANVVVNNGSSAVGLNIVAKTNVPWWLEILMTARSVGAGTAATLFYQVMFVSESVVGAAAGAASSSFMPTATPAVGAGFDSTIANVVDLQAKFSVSTATTSIQLHQFIFETLS